MITVEQAKRGLAAYLDAEMLPKLSVGKQWAVGLAVAFELENLPNRIAQAAANPMISGWQVISPNGSIDLDRLYNKLRPIAEKSGEAEIPVPVIGPMRISAADIDQLYDYLRRA